MELKITAQKENALFERREVRFTLKHDGATTPSRAQVRQQLAAELGTKTENVIVDSLEAQYGRGVTDGSARAYKSIEAARGTERVHFQKRNQIHVEKPKKEKPAAAEGAAAPAAKPAKKGGK